MWLFAPFANKMGLLITNIGGFALVGALVNGVTLYGYGSWITLDHFNEFKITIKSCIMAEFFSIEEVEKILTAKGGEVFYDLGYLDQCLDYDQLYEAMVEALLESPLRGMIKLAGGQARFEPLRAIFKKKVSKIVLEYSRSEILRDKLINSTNSREFAKALIVKIELMIDVHLRDLTRDKFKDLLTQGALPHLVWLVAWGAILGGIMGAIKTLLI